MGGQEKGKPHPLMAEMNTGTGTMESGMEIPKN